MGEQVPRRLAAVCDNVRPGYDGAWRDAFQSRWQPTVDIFQQAHSSRCRSAPFLPCHIGSRFALSDQDRTIAATGRQTFIPLTPMDRQCVGHEV